MANIIGTVISVKDYLSSEDVKVYINGIGNAKSSFTLPKNRKYIIPDFQREIRWEKENVIELISDIQKGGKFLGNIILSNIESKSTDYYLIDGQQRTTVLMMIIYCIYVKFEGSFNTIELCELENQSFIGLKKLFENKFDFDALSEKQKESDYYGQKEQYEKIWNAIRSSDALNNNIVARSFFTNVMQCSLNIIVNKDRSLETSIENFLDVNLKGVKLDNEDIFKSYLFSYDNSSEVRDYWRELKKKCTELKKDNKKYSIMNLVDQYIATNINEYDNGKYSGLEFNENLTLKDTKTIDNITYYKGQYIIAILCDNAFMKNSLMEMNQFMDAMLDIIGSRGITKKFKEYFAEVKIDDVEQQIIFKLIQTIMLDSATLTKSLLIKYYLDCLMEDNIKNKKRKISYIYGIYLYHILFSNFSLKKSRTIFKIFYDSNGDWYQNLIMKIRDIISKENIEKLSPNLRYSLEENEDEKYRCKAIAAVYNYFSIDEKGIKIKNKKDLKEFLYNDEKYSIEHFVIDNNPNNIMSFAGKDYEIPNKIDKYKNRIYNFIFIDSELNNKLGIANVNEKIKLIEEDKNNRIECEYSKMIIDLIKTILEDITKNFKFTTDQERTKFFNEEFEHIYHKYARKVMENIILKIRNEK